jgi:hypothetical protein
VKALNVQREVWWRGEEVEGITSIPPSTACPKFDELIVDQIGERLRESRSIAASQRKLEFVELYPKFLDSSHGRPLLDTKRVVPIRACSSVKTGEARSTPNRA